MKLSIIIPVYNAVHYLEKCVSSCQGKDCEIILVNDGSTDSSLEKMRSLAARLPDIRLYSQVNKGVGGARNYGLRNAQGDYVWFVDADDFLEEGATSYVLKTLEEHAGKDYISLVSRHTGGGGDRNMIPPRENARDVFESDRWLDMATLYIFRRQFLLDHGLFFKERLFFEDSEFTPKALYLAKDCFISNRFLYNIFDHEGTITRSRSVRKGYDRIRGAEYLKEFRDASVKEPASRAVFSRKICVLLNRALWEIGFFGKDERQKMNRELRGKKALMKVFRESGIARYKAEYLLFCLSGGEYAAVFRFLNRFKGL